MKTINNLDLQKERVIKIQTDVDHNILRVTNQSHNSRYSWFMTDDTGDVSLSGNVVEKDITISLENLSQGVYHFRAQGEKIELQVGIAS